MVFTFASLANPATACVLSQPPSCETNEAAPTCQKRAEQWYADKEAARIESEKKTPEERTLIEQSRLWDDHEFVFLARVGKIKLGGKVYPRPEPKLPKSRNGKIPPPPLPVAVPLLSPAESHQALIHPIRWIKGAHSFLASWQYVGGMTSCGNTTDGSLGYAHPGDEVIIFAYLATTSQMVRGKWISSESLNLYGLNRDEVMEPRILEALAEKPVMINPMQP